MSEATFREEIAKLEPNEYKVFVAEVIFSATASGKNEMFDVYVYNWGAVRGNSNTFYKLQWKKNGKPELPRLKEEITKKALKIFEHNHTFLTAGFGHHWRVNSGDAIEGIDNLVLVIKEFRHLGIIIKI